MKWYEAPELEIVEMETSVSLLAASDDEDLDDSTGSGFGGDTGEIF